MKYYAHSSDTPEKEWQSVIAHLSQTAEMAAKNADKFNSSGFGYTCGILHDIGKYSDAFQKKLQGQNIRVDHSTAGAKEVINLFGEIIGKLIAYCIAGHHSGLHDYGSAAYTEGTLYSRLNKEVEDYSVYKNELDLLRNKPELQFNIKEITKFNRGFTLGFFVRMLYSCLVDADFIDTETYMTSGIKQRSNHSSLKQLNKILNDFLTNLKCPDSKINNKRKEILHRCLEFADQKRAIFSLTVPTGGGKTYSSIAFALNHALVNNLERIIYVIPFTSIIEQNAKVFKNILGTDNVLEHHCNYQYKEIDNEDIQSVNERLKLASENWDIPIIVTTNVQFFESLFANKSSKCRKIHNIARSVIIFDEAQMLPVEYLKPCLLAISELVYNYNSSVVLCTATQPSINDFLPPGLKPIEIMDNPKQLYNDFKKVKVEKKNELTDDDLIEELNKNDQVLCILNTRKHAKAIFDKLMGNKYHLSTLMCPKHRQDVLKEIKECLAQKIPCKVVSTQLIEAGVDIDFPIVYRSMAGIDSIVQSAGRCNREGLLSEGKVFVFKPISEYAKVKGYLERTGQIAEMVFRKFDDPISLGAIDYYFNMLYDIEGEKALDKHEIIDCFENRASYLEFDFRRAAQNFKLIANNTYPIIVPFDNIAKNLIEEARYSKFLKSVSRKLQPYTVSIYEYEFKSMEKNKSFSIVNNLFYVLNDFEKHYDLKTGLILNKDEQSEAIFA